MTPEQMSLSPLKTKLLFSFWCERQQENRNLPENINKAGPSQSNLKQVSGSEEVYLSWKAGHLPPGVS